jgi:hypothetical protein
MQPLTTNRATVLSKDSSSLAKSPTAVPYKNIVFSTLSILSAFSFGYFYVLYLGGVYGIWPMIGFLAVFCVLSVIRAVVGHDTRGSIGIIFVETLVMTGPFALLVPFETFSLVAIVVFAFFLWGYAESREEAERCLEIRFFKIAHPYINKIVTGAVLMMAIFYLPVLGTGNAFLSEASFESFLRASAVFVKYIYPDFDPQSTVGTVTAKFAENQAAQQPDFARMPERTQQFVIQQSVSSTISNINSSLKIHVDTNESVENALYDFVTTTLNGWKERFGTWFFVGWVALVFLLVRSIGFFFSLAVSFLTFLVFYALVAMKIVKIGSESRMKEIAKL